MTRPGATPESVTAALPQIKDRFKLTEIALVPTASGNYKTHVKVNPEDDTGEHKLAGDDTAALLKQAKAEMGKKFVLVEERCVAVVTGINEPLGIVMLTYEIKQGRGQNKGTGRGYRVKDFIDSLTTHKYFTPYSGGGHQSRFAVESKNSPTGYILDPGYRADWRSLFYPTDYGATWDAWKLDRLTRPKDSGGYCDPADVAKDLNQRHWWWSGTWWLNEQGGKGEATLDHNPAVVEHWNSDGYVGTQASRKQWYQAGPFEMIPREENSRRAAAVRGMFKDLLGENFRGPGE
jgi:hypothetical protein